MIGLRLGIILHGDTLQKLIDYFVPSSEVQVARFLDSGGQPPDGVTMLGRWHVLGGGEAFVLAETEDPRTIYRRVSEWADLIEFEVVPVIEDADAAQILQELKL